MVDIHANSKAKSNHLLSFFGILQIVLAIVFLIYKVNFPFLKIIGFINFSSGNVEIEKFAENDFNQFIQ
jgi:hypothetical protein